MNKEEARSAVMGAISMALKDPILQQGFECICKELADLEKENAELKKLKRECETSLCRAEYQYNYEQLTKAKDLLLRFVELKNKPCASGHSINMLLYENICAETEQFLKDSEGEK